jgi:hypothetical protein
VTFVSSAVIVLLYSEILRREFVDRQVNGTDYTDQDNQRFFFPFGIVTNSHDDAVYCTISYDTSLSLQPTKNCHFLIVKQRTPLHAASLCYMHMMKYGVLIPTLALCTTFSLKQAFLRLGSYVLMPLFSVTIID